MSQSEIRNAVVLVIDRLGANMLGAYGSTWFETQNFNRLAARSVVFDYAITQTTDLEAAYQGLWNSGSDRNLLTQLGDSGISPVLLTDDPEISNLPVSEDFDRIVSVNSGSAQHVAPGIEQTELANFFAQAAQAMIETDGGSCLWLHSRGLSGSWDAPQGLRTQLADPEDPEPPNFWEPPAKRFDPQADDPDELLGYQQICAAQVTMIDDFLGVMLDLLESEVAHSTMFCLLSTRGFPLGEHGLVGDLQAEEFASCYSESVHVPLMVCLPNHPRFELTRSIRNGSLVQPNLIPGLLVDWFGSDNSILRTLDSMSQSFPNKQREIACTIRGETIAIQTHAWKLIHNQFKDELFAKPDDRCEVNDVSRRCPNIVESLTQSLGQLVVDGNIALPIGFELSDELVTRTD